MSDEEGQPTPPEQPGYGQQPPPPPPQPQFNPQSAYPQPEAGQPSSGQPNPGQPYSGQPYSGQPYPQQPYAGQPYPPAPGHPGMPQFPVYVLPDHPKATSALIVGIIAVAGTFLCGLPILASPVAWVLGAQARREIRSAPHQWGGESKATAGMVLGIIGSVLLALALLVIALIIVLAVADSNGFGSDTSV